MARVLYTGSVAEFRGSVAGSTFQRNSAGTIVKAKNNQRFSSSVLQLGSQQSFAQIVSLWNNINPSFKPEWNDFATDNARTNFYGRVLHLNGFQWFNLINRNLITIGLSPISEPPSDANVFTLPGFYIDFDSTTITLHFSSPANLTNAYVLVFATSPTSRTAIQSRVQKLFITKFTGNPVSSADLTAGWEAAFGTSWASIVSSGIFTIGFSIYTISKLNGVSSAFYSLQIMPGS